MVQETDYPWSGKVSITVNPKQSKKFAVHIRVPNRAVSALYRPTPDANGITSIAVNGAQVKAKIDKGYAVISRTWKAGDKIDFELPMKPQRIQASDKIEATRNKVALRYGPLIYNIEQNDQDITKTLAPGSPLATEWRPDLLGGIVVVKGTFSDGSPMLAIPNFVRKNREAGLDYPPAAPPPGPDGKRPAPRPPTSIVWIKET